MILLRSIVALAATVLLLQSCDAFQEQYEREELGRRLNYDGFRALVTEYPNIESIDCGTDTRDNEDVVLNCLSNQFESNFRAYGFIIDPSVDPVIETSAFLTTTTGRYFKIKYDSNRDPENGKVYLFITECNNPNVIAISNSTYNEIACSSATPRTTDDVINSK